MLKAVTKVADVPDSLQLLSVRQVANILLVREDAVRRLIYSGNLPALRIGIFIRVRRDALEAYLEQNPCTQPDERRDPRRKRRGDSARTARR